MLWSNGFPEKEENGPVGKNALVFDRAGSVSVFDLANGAEASNASAVFLFGRQQSQHSTTQHNTAQHNTPNKQTKRSMDSGPCRA